MPELRTAAQGFEQQYGAICYRVTAKGNIKVLLITSRGSGRWIVPKGWPMPGRRPWDVARIEAWEEAGVRAIVSTRAIGAFTYEKWRQEAAPLPCRVDLFPAEVINLAEEFPEKGQRLRQWFDPKDAAQRVAEPALAKILASFHHELLQTMPN